jgi:hypothetical protein
MGKIAGADVANRKSLDGLAQPFSYCPNLAVIAPLEADAFYFIPNTCLIVPRFTGWMMPFSVMMPAINSAGVTSKAGL